MFINEQTPNQTIKKQFQESATMEISASSDNLRSFACKVLWSFCQQREKNNKQGCSNLQNMHGPYEDTACQDTV